MRVLTIDIKAQFASLANQLSPENVSCDGELSAGQVRLRVQKLRKDWEALEKQCGQKVMEHDTWAWHDELRKHEENAMLAELATYEDHPLLVKKRPGSWYRQGAAYAWDAGEHYTLYYISKRRERKTVLMGKTYTENADQFYTLASEFSRALYRDDVIGEYNTLQEAVDAGEAFLKEDVTRENFKACTGYSDENIARELAKLG